MEPDEMPIEMLNVVYGKPERLPLVTHVLGTAGNLNHDRVVIEVATSDKTRLEIPFTQAAIKMLARLIEGDLGTDRPKVN